MSVYLSYISFESFHIHSFSLSLTIQFLCSGFHGWITIFILVRLKLTINDSKLREKNIYFLNLQRILILQLYRVQVLRPETVTIFTPSRTVLLTGISPTVIAVTISFPVPLMAPSFVVVLRRHSGMILLSNVCCNQAPAHNRLYLESFVVRFLFPVINIKHHWFSVFGKYNFNDAVCRRCKKVDKFDMHQLKVKVNCFLKINIVWFTTYLKLTLFHTYVLVKNADVEKNLRSYDTGKILNKKTKWYSLDLESRGWTSLPWKSIIEGMH